MQVKIEDHFLGEVASYDKVPGKSPYPDEVLKAFKNAFLKSSKPKTLLI